jgi:AcrR family transcriptional regulator
LIREGALSLREVARHAGVSVAAPARHFDSKEALLAAIACSGFDELWAERRAIAAQGASPLASAYRMMTCYVAFARRHSGLFHLMVGPVIIDRAAHPELVTASNRSFNLFAEAVTRYASEQGWAARHNNLLIHAAWATEHGVAMLLMSKRVPRREMPLEQDDMVRFSLSLLLSGIAAGPAALQAITRGRGRDAG